MSIGTYCVYKFLKDNNVSLANSKPLIGFLIFSTIGFIVCRKLFVTTK